MAVDSDSAAAPPMVDDDLPVAERLLLDIEGYEGPIDVLLTLAREQKVDLLEISILELAEQFLEFVTRARERRLELAADYLVMAAWLAYLKSRLLLPRQDDMEQEAQSPEEMAQALAFQLRRLEAMKEAGARLLQRPQLGVDIFARGMPEPMALKTVPVYEAGLYDLLAAYGAILRVSQNRTMSIEAFDLYAMDDAIRRLRDLFGARRIPQWTALAQFLPTGLGSPLKTRSAVAAHFVASLEMCRDGALELRQDGPFAPVLLRSPGAKPTGEAEP